MSWEPWLERRWGEFQCRVMPGYCEILSSPGIGKCLCHFFPKATAQRKHKGKTLAVEVSAWCPFMGRQTTSPHWTWWRETLALWPMESNLKILVNAPLTKKLLYDIDNYNWLNSTWLNSSIRTLLAQQIKSPKVAQLGFKAYSKAQDIFIELYKMENGPREKAQISPLQVDDGCFTQSRE